MAQSQIITRTASVDFSSVPRGIFSYPGWAGKIDPDRFPAVEHGALVGAFPGKWQFIAPWYRSWSNDQFSEITIASTGHDKNSGVCVWTRGHSTTGGTLWVRLLLRASNGVLYLQRYTGSHLEMIVTEIPYSPRAGDVLRLENYGGLCRALINSEVVIPEHMNEVCPFGFIMGLGVYSDGPHSKVAAWRGGEL